MTLMTSLHVAEVNGGRRVSNSRAHPSVPFRWLLLHSGTEPGFPPATASDVMSIVGGMSIADVDSRLAAYSLPVDGAQEQRRRRLAEWLGLVW